MSTRETYKRAYRLLRIANRADRVYAQLSPNGKETGIFMYASGSARQELTSIEMWGGSSAVSAAKKTMSDKIMHDGRYRFIRHTIHRKISGREIDHFGYMYRKIKHSNYFTR